MEPGSTPVVRLLAREVYVLASQERDYEASNFMEFIRVRGARQHNLKNIDVDIPKNKLVVFTGLSGSGKSSLAFDTIYAEGQRRYVESLSSYARQFLGVMDKPDVDHIEGLSPAISIDQKSTSHNPRSTVGTVTEIYDYLRLLFARIGHPHCPSCGREIERQSTDQIVAGIIKKMDIDGKSQTGTRPLRFLILSPVVRDRKGEFLDLFDNLVSKGYKEARIDGRILDLDSDLVLIKTNKHTVEVVIDRLTVSKKELRNPISRSNLKTRLNQGVEAATALSAGLVIASQVVDSSFDFPKNPQKFSDHLFSELFACPVCNLSLPEIEPRTFSFNSPHGACSTCSGIGTLLKIDPELVFNPNLTISEGGILPYAKMFFHDTWWSRVISTVAEVYGINLRIKTGELSTTAKKILLYGTGLEIHEVAGQNRWGRKTTIYEPFAGIIPDLEKRYRETESDYVRSEIQKFMRVELCPSCSGARLKKDALSVTINGNSIVDVTSMSSNQFLVWIKKLPELISEREKAIGTSIIKEIFSRVGFLVSVGLEYLTLDRSATTLSGGEAQRIRLASQIGSGLSGVLYVLDEPSIGLHQRDNIKLIETLKNLRDLGNTVVVVEHDREIMEQADWIFDFGPGAGRAGGQVIFSGNPTQLKKSSNLTGLYLSGKKEITVQKAQLTLNARNLETQKFKISNRPKNQLSEQTEFSRNVTLVGANANNLKNLTVSFPLGKMICVTGVSGSGKSTLIVDTLYHAIAHAIYPGHRERGSNYKEIQGLERINKIILVDQSPIGRTPRSNPATYTGLFGPIREIFSDLPQARERGFGPGRFSFNVSAKGGKGGRCEACEGEGQIKIEMQFLADVYVTCEVCHGKRYNSETLEIKFKGKNIADILEMTVLEALEFFGNIPTIAEKLQSLHEVGLSYIHLGQPAPTLSGGEAQRTKLAAELSKRDTGNTVYVLDEPTTGLHFADLVKLLTVLKKLTLKGNTVIVIEHNLDIVKNADYLIDLGPEGGEGGGRVVASGSPVEISQQTASYTGQYLRKIFTLKIS